MKNLPCNIFPLVACAAIIVSAVWPVAKWRDVPDSKPVAGIPVNEVEANVRALHFARCC